MAILFDLDDTLLDHTSALRAGAKALHARLGSASPYDTFVADWEASLRHHYDRYLAGEISYEQQRVERIRDVIHPALTDAEATEWFSTYLDGYESGWRLFADAASVLDELCGHALGVITNGQVEQQRRKLEATGIMDRFACVVISEKVGVAKPAAQIFRMACDLIGEEPACCAYIGDRYDLDAEGARRAGLVGIWLDRQGAATADHQGPIITTLSQLPNLVFAQGHLPG